MKTLNGLTAIKKQTDTDFEAASEASGTDCSNLPDLTRQEDAPFTDINFQLKMFGLNPFAPRQPEFGTVDYDFDMQNALQAVSDTKTAWKTLPAALREKYQSWVQLLAAAEAGELANIDLKTGLDKPKEPANVPPTPQT